MKESTPNIFKKYAFTFLWMLLFGLYVSAQKTPQYTQYMYNIGSFNPGYAASVVDPEISGLYRAQWLDVPGAPRTFRLGVNLPFSNEKNGLGFNVISDQLGPTSQNYIEVAYSYQINLSDDTKLSFGINAGGSLLDIDFSKGDFEFLNEPLLSTATINKFYPVIGAGAFLYADDWYLGLSVPNFLIESIYDQEVVSIVEDKPQFNLIGGYVFELSDNLKFKPAFLMNYLESSPMNLNLSANFLMNDVFTLGASYRSDNAVSGLAGFQISNGTFIGYSYDYSTNGLGDYNNGSHELILKFYLGREKTVRNRKDKNKKLKGKPKQIDTPRFF